MRRTAVMAGRAVGSAVVAALVLAGCSVTEPAPRSAAVSGDPVSVDVGPAEPLDMTIDGVGRLSAPAGTFSADGQMHIDPNEVNPEELADLGISAAGWGLDVTFTGTALTGPVALTLGTDGPPEDGPPEDGDLPVLAHRADDGTWDYLPAALDEDGAITAQTTGFSFVLPGWANPARWWSGVTSLLTSAVGGRSAPLSCSGAPEWFRLDPSHSDLVHACAKTNTVSDGTQVAEVQIKSNRGVVLDVAVPGRPDYVWVDGQPFWLRQWVSEGQGRDPDRQVLLPAGATMTVGYRQPPVGLDEAFFITPASDLALAQTLVTGLVDYALGEVDPVVIAWSLSKCFGSWRPLGRDPAVDNPNAAEFFGCMLTSSAGELADTDTAVAFASRSDGSVDVDRLKAKAKRLKALGWATVLIPAFQAGWGTVVDKIRELATGGSSAEVRYSTTAAVLPTQTVVVRPVTADGDVAPGFTVEDRSADGTIDCSFDMPGAGAVDPGIIDCSPHAASAHMCWPVGGLEVLCLPNVFGTVVARMTADSVPPPTTPSQGTWPVGLVLADGRECHAALGGAWDSPAEHPDWGVAYACDGSDPDDLAIVWGSESMPALDHSGSVWTVLVGTTGGPWETTSVESAYYVGTA